MTSSAASLTISDNLVLRDIDDKAIEHGFFSQKKIIELSAGAHTLVLKYKDVFEDLDMAEERLVTSDYFVIKFTVENQQKLLLSTNKISNLSDAERFAQSPELTLFDEKKHSIVLVLQKLDDYELAKQVNNVLTRLTETEITPINVSTDNNKHENEQDFNDKVIEKVDVVPMLKYWWKKASDAEKEQFFDFAKLRK